MTRKQAILKYFSLMDIDMLHSLLADNKTYQKVTKTQFLVQLNDIFNCFKGFKDSELIIYDGICSNNKKCYSKDCKCYVFVANKSLNYINIAFIETEKDIKNIINCNEIQIICKAVKLKAYYSIYFSRDEEADYIMDRENREIHESCKIALNEILSDRFKILTLNSILTWLLNNKWLFSKSTRIVEPTSKVRDLTNLYDYFARFYNTTNYEEDAKNAFNEYKKVNHTNDDDLINWLLKFEGLANTQRGILTSTNFNDEFELISDYVNFPSRENTFIQVDGFRNLLSFNSCYEYHYNTIVNKYNKFINDDEYKSADTEKRFFLKFHLMNCEIWSN